MLLQFLDRSHVRIAFKARPDDRWHSSAITEVKDKHGAAPEGLLFLAWNASCGDPPERERVGFPLYQQYRWDDIRYRYGTTAVAGDSGR